MDDMDGHTYQPISCLIKIYHRITVHTTHTYLLIRVYISEQYGVH